MNEYAMNEKSNALKRYFKLVVQDFLTVCGTLTVFVAVWLLLDANAEMSRTVIWRIVLLAITLMAFKHAFFKVGDLEEKAQMVSYFIFSSIAAITLMFFLSYFTPGGSFSKAATVPILLTVVGAKLLNSSMMYWDAKSEAKAINDKLQSISKDKS